jgi:hypothetical protein
MKVMGSKDTAAAELYRGFVCLAVRDAFDVRRTILM